MVEVGVDCCIILEKSAQKGVGVIPSQHIELFNEENYMD